MLPSWVFCFGVARRLGQSGCNRELGNPLAESVSDPSPVLAGIFTGGRVPRICPLIFFRPFFLIRDNPARDSIMVAVPGRAIDDAGDRALMTSALTADIGTLLR